MRQTKVQLERSSMPALERSSMPALERSSMPALERSSMPALEAKAQSTFVLVFGGEFARGARIRRPNPLTTPVRGSQV